MNESPQSLRTIDDIRRERGQDFPQKHKDAVMNKNTRTDFLLAAYDMIISPPRNASIFERLLYAGGFSARNTMISLIKGRGKQLGLMGIFKKIIAYDNSISEVYALNDADFMKLLREMQQLCAPETIKKTPERPLLTTLISQKITTITAPENQGPHLLGRKITSPVILGILEAIPVLPEPEPEKVIEQEQPKKTETPPTVTPTQTNVSPTQGTFIHRKPILPPAPRRGEKPQHPGRRQWHIPHHVRQGMIASTQQPTLREQAPIEPITPLPEFETKEMFFSFLRIKTEWNDCLRLLSTLKDDLACMAHMGQLGFQELSRILSANKVKWGYKNFRDLIEDMVRPEIHQVEEKKEAVVSTERSQIDTSEFQLSTEHEKLFRDIFSLHTAGKYGEFLQAFEQLKEDDETVQELLAVKEAFGCKDVLHTLAYISSYTLTTRDIQMYRTHTWYERICELPGVQSQIERLLDHEKRDSMQTIKKILEDVTIKVPDDIRTPWKGFEEQALQKKTLFEVVIQLVKTRKVYQKKDEDRTKRLILVVRQIVGQVEITQDDEDIVED